MRNRKRTGWHRYINGLNISAAVVVIFVALPLYWLIASSFKTPPTGTGSYARSWAPTPDPPADHTVHTKAEPEVVPLEVTTGALELKPKASEDCPTRLRVGVPAPLRPYW